MGAPLSDSIGAEEDFRGAIIMSSERRRKSCGGGSEPKNESGEAETKSKSDSVEEEQPGDKAFGSEFGGSGDSGPVSQNNTVERDTNTEFAAEAPVFESIRVDGDLLGSIIVSEPWRASSDERPEPKNESEERESKDEFEETETRSQGNGGQQEAPGEVAFGSELGGSGYSGPVSQDNTVERDTNAELYSGPVSQDNTVERDTNAEFDSGLVSQDNTVERDTNAEFDSGPVSQDNTVERDTNAELDSGRVSLDNTVERDSNAELATEAPVSDSIGVKEGRAANGMSVSPADKKPMSKKRKAAKDDNAKPKKWQQELQQQEGGKKPKKGYVFPYGNYHRYYGYRLTKSGDEDPRLKFFRRDWFEGKDCLDVGCNEGFITISIAQKYKCQSIVGVDLDNFLIDKATRNLEAAAESNALDNGAPAEEGSLGETVVVRTCDNSGERCDERLETHSAPDWGDERPCPGSESLLHRVKFRQEQFIENFPRGNYMKDGTFDTVLCLSVTKWVHLNWGDTGLIRLFAKIFHILRPGGILVLEPQPWRSYEKKYYVSEVTKRCYETIQLRPTHFKQVLLDKIGFRSVEEVSQAVPNSSLGFDRSLFLYFK